MKKLFLLSLISLLMTSCATASGPNPKVTMETSKGKIEIEVLADKQPELAKNFLYFVKEGKYESVPFHRVIKNFMIQTGDFENKNGSGGYSYKGPGTELPGDNSMGLSNARGTLAMANRGKDTNGSQFFINLVDNKYLDDKHPVFAKVIAGMDIVDKIAKVETDGRDNPKEAVLMTKLTVHEQAKK